MENGFVGYANAPNWNGAVYVCVCRNRLFGILCYALMQMGEYLRAMGFAWVLSNMKSEKPIYVFVRSTHHPFF